MSVDAFISYSHAADARLAPVLERGLERLARPWYRLRAVSVFRDQTDLSLTPHLWTTISAALDAASWLVLLASPAAAASPYVNREIEHFCAVRGADRVLLVLTDGELDWDDARGDFSAASTAVPPALRGRFAAEPLWLDLRWARSADVTLAEPRLRAAVAQVAAPIRGVAPDELEGEDIRLHRQARRLARAAVASLAVLAVAASSAAVLAVRAARLADERARVAVGRQLGLAALDLPPADLDRAFLLALAAAELDPAGPARYDPARTLVGRVPRLTALLPGPAGDSAVLGLRAVAVTPAAVAATAVRADGSAVLLRWDGTGGVGAAGGAGAGGAGPRRPPQETALPPEVDPTGLLALPDGGLLVGAVGGSALRVPAGGGTPGPVGVLLAADPTGARALVAADGLPDPGGRQDAGGARLLDLVGGRPVGPGLPPGEVVAAQAVRGHVVALTPSGTVLLDAASGAVTATGPAAGAVAVGAVPGDVPAGAPAVVTADAAGTVTAWRAQAGRLVAAVRVTLPAGSGPARAVVAGAGGRFAVVAGPRGAALVDLHDARVADVDPAADGLVTADPAGRRAAAGGRRLVLWDLGRGSRTLAAPVPVAAAAWSGPCDAAGGCRLVTAGETLDVWTPASGRRVMLTDRTNTQAVAVTPDGATVVSAGWGRSAAVWTVRSTGSAGEDLAAGGPVVVDPAADRRVPWPGPGGGGSGGGGAGGGGSGGGGSGGGGSGGGGGAVRVVLAAGGTRLVDLAGAAGPPRVRDATSGAAVALDRRCTGDLVATSPTRGLLVALRRRDGLTAVCSLGTGELLARAVLTLPAGAAQTVAVDDDGSVGVGGGGVVTWFGRDGATWRRGVGVDARLGGGAVDVRALAVRGGVVAAGLRPPARDAGEAGDDAQDAGGGRALVWDAARAGTPVQFDVDGADVAAVALLGADGRLVAVASRDAAAGPVTVEVWESASRRRVGRGLGGLAGDVVALGGDARAVTGADAAGHAVRWGLDADPAREVCGIVGRPLTRQEWAAAAGGALRGYGYRPVCG